MVLPLFSIKYRLKGYFLFHFTCRISRAVIEIFSLQQIYVLQRLDCKLLCMLFIYMLRTTDNSSRLTGYWGDSDVTNGTQHLAKLATLCPVAQMLFEFISSFSCFSFLRPS